MKRTGLRGRSSPMNDATDEQRAAVAKLAVEAEAEGAHIFEVRYATWIGAGCAADRGAICVSVDGRIYNNVEKDGTLT